MLENTFDPILYVRGVPNSNFYLILQGEVVVCSGQEGFYVKMGPYNYLGLDALENSDFIPDFSAKVINNARLLRMTHKSF
jgi:hypothetical protein